MNSYTDTSYINRFPLDIPVIKILTNHFTELISLIDEIGLNVRTISDSETAPPKMIRNNEFLPYIIINDSTSQVYSMLGYSQKYISEIRRLIESGRIREARKYLNNLLTSGEWCPELESWRTVLEESVVTIESEATGEGDLKQNKQWLIQHAIEYQGQWVALRQGKLLDSDEHLKNLHDKLRIKNIFRAALFYVE